MSSSGQHLPSSAAESLSLTHDDRASSTRRDQEPSASDIELVPLVPAVYSSLQPQEGADSLIDKTSHQTPPTDAFRLASRQPHLYNNKPSATTRLLLDSWVYEAVAIGLSIACLAAIAAIVAYYDEKAVPESVITLNTAVSVLSTAARSGLIFVVSAVVGQMKWCWIRKSERQLQHLQTMDSASRGPMGAIQMVALWTGGTLAAAGGILTVLLVAFSPFLQQLLDYPLRDAHTPSSDAWVPQNLDYNSVFNGSDALTGRAPGLGDAISAVNDAEWAIPKPLDFDATCPVSRCSWHNVKSVGWCSECEDVTATAAASLERCDVDDLLQDNDFYAPCALNIGNREDLRNFGSAIRSVNRTQKDFYFKKSAIWPVSYGGKGYKNNDFSGPNGDADDKRIANERGQRLHANNTLFVGVKDPLLVFGQVTLSTYEPPLERGQDMLHIDDAHLCILSLCEREYSVTKEGCTTTWTETSRNYGSMFKTRQLCDGEDDENPNHEFGAVENIDLVCWRPVDSDPILERVGDECKFADSAERAICPVDYFADAIDLPDLGDKFGMRRVDFLPSTDSTEDLYNLTKLGSDTGKHDLVHTMETLAKVLTTFGLNATTNRVTGYTITPEAYVHVRWQWMIFPVALELATLTLFILVVIHSRREGVPIWKSSILAIIYHSVEELRNERSPPTERLSDMQSAAKATAVGLWKSDDGLHRMARRPR